MEASGSRETAPWSTALAVKPWGQEFRSKHPRYKQGIPFMPITPVQRESRQEHCCDLLASRLTKKTWASDLGRDPPQRSKQRNRKVHPVPSSRPCAHTDTCKQKYRPLPRCLQTKTAAYRALLQRLPHPFPYAVRNKHTEVLGCSGSMWRMPPEASFIVPGSMFLSFLYSLSVSGPKPRRSGH